MINCQVKLADGAILPKYETKGAAGADVSALIDSDIVLLPGTWQLIPTGLFFQIPEGYEIQVRPRSGLSLKHGVTVLNSPGTIDSDYRGELKVILINHSKENFIIKNHDRIAQIVFSKVTLADYTITDTLDNTMRGTGGFGSTGK